jgi:2-keto-4-pentenoate hydratase
MEPARIAEAASALVAARRNRSRIGPLPEACRPRSAAEAHAIQDTVTAMLSVPVGAFKANAPPGSDPTRAPIYAPTIHASPARMSAQETPQCGVEGEVAFRFRRDLPPRPTPYTRDDVAAAVDACAAIEVVTSRFADPDAAVLDKLADCISNGGFVHGALKDSWHGLELGKLKVTLTVNGETVVDQVGGHPTGDPLGIAVALVEMVRASGGVQAGQFVTCGSCTGLRYLKPGDVCHVSFDGLGTADVTVVP